MQVPVYQITGIVATAYITRFLTCFLRMPLDNAIQNRSLDPSKDPGVYGYGSIAWKERVESWKNQQDKMLAPRGPMMGMGHGGHPGGPDDPNGPGGADLPMYNLMFNISKFFSVLY
jgi:hypothetical protein